MNKVSIKHLIKEAETGAHTIANGKLCWELTDRSREMLAQEIFHLVMGIALKVLDLATKSNKPTKRSIIIE